MPVRTHNHIRESHALFTRADAPSMLIGEWLAPEGAQNARSTGRLRTLDDCKHINSCLAHEDCAAG